MGFEVANVTGEEGKTVSLALYREGCIRKPLKVFIGFRHITTSST